MCGKDKTNKMKRFKFLQISKRPTLDKFLSVDDLIFISEYCIDFVRGETSGLLEYFPHIGLVHKTFGDGNLRGLGFNYYKDDKRIHIRLDIEIRGISYVFIVKYMDVTTPSQTHIYTDLHEEI